ncbi:bifunctional oligoribonuclease/PAP phosphatase NrnA [Tissierella pigra]|uniref:Bifunctional oligoribonuclease/PAP phosphatase NrnA n=1 Tax=Tissierella pigra TaxID=2607614 RepID=A0A6N7XW15_9FIRM|nr:bifunctional oligoribonuclease/PAP phosphatase NrnA [Tissierella pigra]MBU5426575.1 bifunctional oligoribonuclease/PAP phosphatase NrnA [Tissierella pigra]MST99979.1 bifunctional oligoribonuclease/PAP phosphatase NrnA [Tissierella pigra]
MKNSIESQFDLAIDLIKNSKNIGIASHVSPDGDNIGSILALGNALEKINKKVFILKTDDIPKDFLFLPGISKIIDYEDNMEIDLFITLDTSDEDRLGKNRILLDKIENVVNIDHHISNTNFGDINIVNSNAAATGELVYELIKKIGIIIDKDIASCIYTSISSDTGSFMYDNTTSETHEIAAELIKTGIDKSNININLYQSRSIEKTKLFIKILETLKFHYDNQVGIIKVTQEMLNNSNAKMEDTEGIISFIREISSIEVAILLKEIEEEEIKVSMRSKRYADVAEICANFNGGGHIRAAGCTINEPIATAEHLVLEQMKKVF